MSKEVLFTGAGVALITPFTEDLSKVDYKKLEELINYQIENGTDALVVGATTGEGATLSYEEHIDVIKAAVEITGRRVPVIAGTGSNDTAFCVKLSNAAEQVGADGLLLVTPYYNKTSQSGLIEHFNFVADRVSHPIIVYNVPSRTGMAIKPETYAALAENKRIVAAKEACGNISEIAKTAALCGDNLTIYSGNDDQIVPIMSLGGKGVISVLSHVAPKVAHDIPSLYLEGKTTESAKLQLEYLDICNALFCDVNPIPVKEALNMMGWNLGRCRLPLGTMNDSAKAILRKALANHGLEK